MLPPTSRTARNAQTSDPSPAESTIATFVRSMTARARPSEIMRVKSDLIAAAARVSSAASTRMTSTSSRSTKPAAALARTSPEKYLSRLCIFHYHAHTIESRGRRYQICVYGTSCDPAHPTAREADLPIPINKGRFAPPFAPARKSKLELLPPSQQSHDQSELSDLFAIGGAFAELRGSDALGKAHEILSHHGVRRFSVATVDGEAQTPVRYRY